VLGDNGDMASRFWPLFDLRLTTGRLVLRPTVEADLPELAELVPNDAEPDPSRPRHAVNDIRLDRGIALFQSYWSSFAAWTVDNWRLGFVVVDGSRIVGVQELEARDFPRRKVVETSSWLVRRARGRGLGKEMRAAVLHLAFSGLGALEAETCAWWDNGPSLGVSWALGYQHNGEYIHVHEDRRDRMVRARLLASRWAEVAATYPTTIAGLEGCRHFFCPPAETGLRSPPWLLADRTTAT
jgi:RimJ/RimL family protein N-acetyltransferase